MDTVKHTPEGWPDLKACASEMRAKARECAGFAAHYQREAKRLREQAQQFEELAGDRLWQACRSASAISKSTVQGVGDE